MTDHSRVWRNLPEPLPGHPDETLLWEAEQALGSIGELAENPEIRNAFARRLAAFRAELEGAAAVVAGTEHNIAFIGDIGVGKTSALCRAAGLETAGDMLADAAPTPVLEVGAGGTTICEVHITSGRDYGLVIEPRNESELRDEVNEFARLLMPGADSAPDDETRVAREVARAIRNMSSLQRVQQRGPDGSFAGQIDPAKELAEQLSDANALADAIWTRMAIHNRTLRELWYGDTSDKEPLEWLRENFRMLNNGRNPELSLPQRVEVVIPQRIFGNDLLSIRIVDTKGIDDTAEREDLMVHLNEPNTVAVLCSSFNAAPVTSVQNILERSLEARYRDLETKTAVLVLPHSGQALAVKNDFGDPVESAMEGYAYKREQVQSSLSTANLPGVGVEFFNTHEDDVAQFNGFLTGLVNGLRVMNHQRLEEVVIAALALVDDYENEQARAVQKQAARHLTTWLDSNRKVGGFDGNVQDSLLREIDRVNASSLRASVRRKGGWHNLDYSQQLSHGARVMAANAVVPQLDELKAIITNLLGNSDFLEAASLLQQVVRNLPSETEELLRASQGRGREVHTEYMQPDDLLWERCVGEWGRGPGYKVRVANHNREWFVHDRHGIADGVEDLVNRGWEQILSRIEGILPDDDDES